MISKCNKSNVKQLLWCTDDDDVELYTDRAGNFSCPFHALPCAVLMYAPAADGERGSSSSRRDRRTPAPLFHLPAEFFHPVTAMPQGGLASSMMRAGRPGSRLTSPASWASLRSPGAYSRAMGSQVRLFQITMPKVDFLGP